MNADSPQDADELFTPAWFRDPYPTYDALRARGPVQRLRHSRTGQGGWLITGYREARAALADAKLSKDTHRFFRQKGSQRNLANAVSGTMLATDPPDHTRLRRLVTKAFTTRTVERLRPRVHEITEGLLDKIAAHTAADLIAEVAIPLPVAVISELLGVPARDRAHLHHWSNELFLARQPGRVDAASHQISSYMAHLVAGKRAEPAVDLLSELVADHETGERISEGELVSLATLLLIAGHETTTNLIGNGLLALLQHPAQLSALCEDPALMPRAVEELLRYDSPVNQATFRFATQPVRYGGTDIGADEPVTVAIAAANRDPAQFPDPNSLDITRDTRGHLAFGHGIHHCLGASLARLEAQTALHAILDRLTHLQLACGPDQLRWRHSRLMRGLEFLPVTFTPTR